MVTNSIDLSGQRALVTGGARGIGAAVAKRLADAGAVVSVADIDPDVETLALAMGERVSGQRCDVSNATQLSAWIKDAAPFDILINNAGIFPTTGPMTDATDEFVRHMLDVNVRAQFSASREAAAAMSTNGSIVNMASIAGLRGGANVSAYGASKAALIALTRAFAIELGPAGIRVNAVAPGIIDTPGVREQMAPLAASGIDIDSRICRNPLGIAGQPDHIADAVLFLVSDLALFITGQVLVVDGGVTA